MHHFKLNLKGEFIDITDRGQAEKDRRKKPTRARRVYSSIVGYKCVCLNARSIISKRNELSIMVEDTNPHILGITESWKTTDMLDAELGMTGYAMFRKDRIGRRGGGVTLYIKESIQTYEIILEKGLNVKNRYGGT